MIPIGDLKGLRVLITGASSGIGAAAALALGSCGAHIALHYRSGKSAADDLAGRIGETGGRAVTVSGDLTETGCPATVVQAAAEALGGLDCLINNAGGIERTPVAEADEEVIRHVLDLNMISVLRMVRAATPLLAASERASIINLGSIAGRNGGAPGSSIYAAAKASVHSLTRSMARELAAKSIRVNAVAPGVIETPFHDQTPPEALAQMKSTIPLGRLGKAEDCAWVFAFLASPTMSGYITGQIIDINGGQTMP